ncbi:ribbon-helix-helix domain-containing protein [Myxococcota bacterium]|nr:ribbon-helix-helix domain-containing protein [Myxococcota bacterium]MBU1899490.1 ribbon-helix-helix domain-containing protein [Myxococcota bacterium]
MRIEATVPDARATALQELSSELGISKSQLMDEALTLFLKVVIEAKKGRQIVSLGSENESPCEIVTPSLTQMEWFRSRQPISLNEVALGRIENALDNPPALHPALKTALTSEG